MGGLIKQLTDLNPIVHVITPMEVLICLSLSLVLCLIIGFTYRVTHRGVSYAQSFVITIVMMGVVVSAIMMIIGSNIARAFTLVGALSIIRFRSAIKDTRDVAFIFFAMCAGMSCGTSFYLIGVITTLFLCAAVYLLTAMNYGSKTVTEKILKIQIPTDLDHEKTLGPCLDKHLKEYSLISMESGKTDVLKELVYVCTTKRRSSEQKLLEELRALNGNNKVSLVFGEQVLDI